jgi:hypothetical protein
MPLNLRNLLQFARVPVQVKSKEAKAASEARQRKAEEQEKREAPWAGSDARVLHLSDGLLDSLHG